MKSSAAWVVLLAALAGTEDKPQGYHLVNLGKSFLLPNIEYRTYDQLMYPLRQKLAKGKIEEIDFKVEESMTPKGGLLTAELGGSTDPVVKLELRSDTTLLFTCDDSNQKPGLAMKFVPEYARGPGGAAFRMSEDENRPRMSFACEPRRAMPDSFDIIPVSAEGKSRGHYRFLRGDPPPPVAKRGR